MFRSALPILVAALAAMPALARPDGAPTAYASFDVTAHDQSVTDCDREAGHLQDPFKVVPGKSEDQVDIDAAIAACEAAVAADPGNPRLRYQLGRVYGYSGQEAKANPHRFAAIAAGYPQALFTTGWVALNGLNIEQDRCWAGELLRQSAIAGRFHGQFAFPHYALAGTFDGCDVPRDATEMRGFLTAAAGQASLLSERLLIDNLLARLGPDRPARAAKDTGRSYPVFDPADYDQTVTECDRIAGHKDDPFKVVSGYSENDVDLPAAIRACEAAVAADPGNPRLHYQLGRAYGYSGMVELAMPHRHIAANAGYPQALFTFGFISMIGYNAPKDVCLGGALLRGAAMAGRSAGRIAFPHYAMMGTFDDCPDVRVDDAEMLDFLAQARAQAVNQTSGGFYETLLIDAVEARILDRRGPPELQTRRE